MREIKCLGGKTKEQNKRHDVQYLHTQSSRDHKQNWHTRLFPNLPHSHSVTLSLSHHTLSHTVGHHLTSTHGAASAPNASVSSCLNTLSWS